MVYETLPTYLGSISLDTHAGLPHHSWHPKMETFVLHHEWNEPRSLGKISVNAKSQNLFFSKTMRDVKLQEMLLYIYIPLKWLEDYFPVGKVTFRRYVKLRGGI